MANLGRIMVVIPTYNEKKNVESIISEVFSVLPEAKLTIVDDNSPDGTAEIVRSLMLSSPNLSLLERPQKTGLGDAYKDILGRIVADKSADTIVTMDADGSHQPKYLKDFLAQIGDHDLVVGSRYVADGGVENWEFWRRMLSRFGNIYAKTLVGIGVNDLTAGFLCFKRNLLEKINFDEINATGYAYLIEFKFHCVNRLNAKVKEIPIIFKERGRDDSKISNRIIAEGIRAPLRIFIRRLLGK